MGDRERKENEMGYTNDKEEARAKHAAALRHKKSVLDRLDYQSVLTELNDIEADCSEIAWFDDKDIIELLGNDGDSDNEFRLIATDIYNEARELCERMESGGWHSGFDIEEVFDDVMSAMAGKDEPRLGYDSFQEDMFRLSDYESELAKDAAKKRLSKYTKEQILNLTGECFEIALKWLDIVSGYDYLRATLGVMKDDKQAILNAIKRVDDAYNKAAENDFYGDAGRRFDSIISDLPEDVWVI